VKKVQKINTNSFVCWQGDQIGRIFARWAIVFFGQIFKNYRKSLNSWPAYFQGKSYVYINFAKNWLGYILGNIFKNSSGHPAGGI
jgi:hypothetical protein